MSTDLAQLPVHALAAKLKSRSVSPVDLVVACLERIAKLDPKLHAFVEVYDSEARLAAEAADKAIRSGHAIGPLHGIPIALKDLIELEGRVATGGSAAWRQRRCTRTATLAQKLISAGMIVIGKTHMVEFAYGGWGTNQHLGTPWNPWDGETHHTPGRLEQRLGRRRRSANGALRPRHGHRRLGTPPGCLVRDHWAKNHHRSYQHLWRPTPQSHARYAWSSDA